MSVIVKLEDGTIKILTKGADSIIISWLQNPWDPLVELSMKYVNGYAETGLWTLLLAEWVIKEEDYYWWNESLAKAMILTEGKERILD